LKENTTIEYDGDLYYISYNTPDYRYTKALRKEDVNYKVPKIMYVPAERSFLSVVKTATSVRGLPEPLFEFAEELRTSQNKYKDKEVDLPINGVRYLYDSKADVSYIIGDDYKIDLLIASSGFQSLVPLYMVSLNLATTIRNGTEISPETISVDQSIRMNKEISAIMLNKELNIEERQKQVNAIEARYLNKAFINIVEEPEQNLFPESQHDLLNSLMTFNYAKENKLIITIHSPYLINYLSIATFGHNIKEYLNNADTSVSYAERLNSIIPMSATVSIDDLAVYQLDEYTGTITMLETSEGIPSNNNYLNQSLRHGNALFDALLELDQSI
jgi:hypothetical protein